MTTDNPAAASGPRNETGRWLLQSGCHNGTLTGRDSGTSEHETEQEALDKLDRQRQAWAAIGYRVWFAKLVPPGAPYLDAITLHPGTSYGN